VVFNQSGVSRKPAIPQRRMKKKKTRRQQFGRDSLSARLAKQQKTNDKMKVVLFGRTRLNRAEELAHQWRLVHAMRDKPQRTTKTDEILRNAWYDAKRSAAEYIRDALSTWDPAMLTCLAKEMRREDRDYQWQPDKPGFAILDAARKDREVNLAKVKRDAEKDLHCKADLKTFERRAKVLAIKRRGCGRPKK